jgi:predicted phosphodiesterase
VATAIVSDLHLGAGPGVDVARAPEPLERLCAALARAERVVLLGDLLELRERPATAVLDDVAPTLRRLGEAVAGKPVVVVAGNHDHELIGPALRRGQLERGAAPLPLERSYPPAAGELGARVAELLAPAEVGFAYPGVWVRDDVYAIHGHYLDVHLTVPRVECLLAAASRRRTRRFAEPGSATVDDYEAVLAPIYALAQSLAQSSSPRIRGNTTSISRRVWSMANSDDGLRGRLLGAAVGRAAIPAAVAAINATGFGPFSAVLTPAELRRAGLAAIAETVARLEVRAEHVVFGHTHRAGPFEGEEADWRLPDGGRLSNTGSWVNEGAFLDEAGPWNPYRPGRVTWVDASGPPRLETVLDQLPRRE